MDMAVPSISIMLISSLYNMADTYFVGSLGTAATGGVGVVFSMMAIIQAIGFFFGHGAGNFVSRALGAKNYDDATKMASTGFFTSFFANCVVAVLGIIFLEPLARFLGATETILPYAKEYMFYILLGAPFLASSLMLNNLLRFQGSAVYAMVGMISGAVINVGLDPLFIFTFKMGVAGAAIATMISQIISFILLYVGCMRKDNIRVSLKYFSPSLRSYREMLRGGAPSLFRQGIASVATICLNRVAGGYSDGVIAAVSIVNRVMMFANSMLIGFGQGFQPVCGFNYGAKLYDRVRGAFWFSVKVGTAVLLAFSVVGFAFAPKIISLFRDDPEVIEVGTLALRLMCVTFPLTGWTTMCNMMLQTMGRAVPASLLSLARQGIFMIPLLFILVPFLNVLGIQVVTPLADALTFLLAIPIGIRVLRELKAGVVKLPDKPLEEISLDDV